MNENPQFGTVSSEDPNVPFKAVKTPRAYAFNVNTMKFEVVVPVWQDDQATPREILIHDLKYIADLLESFKDNSYIMPDGKEIPMQTFKLPPLAPEDGQFDIGK